MPRIRVDLMAAQTVSGSGGWMQDIKFAAPVGQAVRAVVVTTALSAPSGSPTLKLMTAPDRSAADADWASAGNSSPITQAGGIAFEAVLLGDFIRLAISAAGAFSFQLGAVSVYLESK